MKLSQATKFFLADRQAQNFSPRTLRFYKYRFLALARFIEHNEITDDLSCLTPGQIRRFITE